MAECEGPLGRAHMQTMQQQAEGRQTTGLPTREHDKGHGTRKKKKHTREHFWVPNWTQ